ncbi:MAG: SDR family oxidoreductase [Spirochaetales bacterium]|nr:SDR family oxidoreductase [Spirochaetales bacterium]
MDLRVIITGATGLLGRAVYNEFSACPDYRVTGLGYKRATPPLVSMDLTDPGTVRHFLADAEPDILIHCAAERKPDISEKEAEGTYNLNVRATETIAESCNEAGAFLVYISTDYVFDGTSPPYDESSKTNPLNNYGKSKLSGEKAVRDQCPDSALLRVTLLYGGEETPGESGVSIIAGNVVSGKNLVMDNWQVKYPLFTPDLAVVIRELVEYRIDHPDFHGIFHWSGDRPYTKYEMGHVVADIAGIPLSILKRNNEPPTGAPRPKDCHLNCSKLEKFGMGRHSDFRENVRLMMKRFGYI